MPYAQEMKGKRFGRLFVVSRHGSNEKKKATWNCACDCGGAVVVTTENLNRGFTKSCGCIVRERAKTLQVTHGLSKSKTYRSWMRAKQRCFNPKDVHFHLYGAVGITVCAEWKYSFETFYKEMGEAPAGHTLDRIDNSRGYEPGNCRWATPKQQSENSRTPRLITFRGKTLNISDWERRLGFNRGLVVMRLSNGWSVTRALTEPPRPFKRKPKAVFPSLPS